MDKFSAIKFSSEEEADNELNSILYSRYKFGCGTSARDLGERLATSLILNLVMNKPETKRLSMAIKKGMRITICSSPYQHIPPAVSAIKDYFIRDFNDHLIEKNHLPVEEIKMYRNKFYTTDYGALSAKARMDLISKDSFYLDCNYISDKFTLYIDDIRITGSHEKMIIRTINQCNPSLKSKGMMVYYGELVGRSCKPDIENYLNYAAVKSLSDINHIVRQDNFIFNARVIKFILGSKHEDCKVFLNYQTNEFLSSLYYYSIGEAYHRVFEYQRNLNYLHSLI